MFHHNHEDDTKLPKKPRFEHVTAAEAEADLQKACIRYAKDGSSVWRVISGKIGDELNAIGDMESQPLPTRATKSSAGYDFYMPFTIDVAAGQTLRFPTFVKCVNMPDDDVLLINNRSSLALNKGIALDNGIGVIDADFNSDIWVQITNHSHQSVTLSKGDRICQGILVHYDTVENDVVISQDRDGGIGSTGK